MGTLINISDSTVALISRPLQNPLQTRYDEAHRPGILSNVSTSD